MFKVAKLYGLTTVTIISITIIINISIISIIIDAL